MDIEELNLSIFSYNVFWKIMKSDNASPLVKTLGQTKLLKLKSNILNNILNTKNYLNPFVYCFQESESSLDIINLFEKSQYKYHLGYSEPEHILTIWRSDIMKKKLVLDGEFEPGRPFSIIVFKDLRYKNYWMLINIHSGHNPHTNVSIFEPIQKLITLNIDSISKYNIKRVVIIGDFNRDISSQIKIEPNKYQLIFNSEEYNFKPTTNTNKTCCSIKGWGYKLNYDQVIDSYSEPILTYQLNKESWYISESSDHLAILSIIKNFNNN
jgi:hypothetical protein